MAIPIPPDVRELLDAPNYVHLATLRTDGSPRSWVVWVGVDGDHVVVCTGEGAWNAKDMRRDPRVSLSVVDGANPYRMAAVQGRVVEVRDDSAGTIMDGISIKYTSKTFPTLGRAVSRSTSRSTRRDRARSTSCTTPADRVPQRLAPTVDSTGSPASIQSCLPAS